MFDEKSLVMREVISKVTSHLTMQNRLRGAKSVTEAH